MSTHSSVKTANANANANANAESADEIDLDIDENDELPAPVLSPEATRDGHSPPYLPARNGQQNIPAIKSSAPSAPLPVPQQTPEQHSLRKFLDAHLCQVKEPGSATIVGTAPAFKQSWTIPDQEYGTFLDHLHDYLFNCGYRTLGLVELHRSDKYSSGIIDLDFKYPSNFSLMHHFTSTQIKQLINELTTCIKSYIKINKIINFYVALRPAPYSTTTGNKYIKDGIHIHYDLHMHSSDHHAIRNYVLSNNIIETAFKDTGYINEPHQIYDEACIKSAGLYIYGESKQNIPAYVLKHWFQYDPATDQLTEQTDTNNYPDSRRLMELLSIRYKLSPFNPIIHDDKLDQWNQLKELKGGGGGAGALYANAGAGAGAGGAGAGGAGAGGADNEWSNNGGNMIGISPIMLPPELMNQSRNTEMICQLITCLNPERRAGEYSDWVNLGLCLKNVGGDTDEMFGAWADITRRVNREHKKAHYSTSKLQEKWKSFRANTLQSSNTIGIGSLHYWAKCDNPERYKDILEGDILTYIERYMDQTHTHFARLLHRLYGNIFVAAMDSKHTEWYKYDKNTWKHVYQASDIREKLAINIPEYLGKLRDRIRPKLADSTNMKATNEQLKSILAMEKALYNCSFKNGVIKDAECYFRDCDFLMKLNANPYLMGFANGILNLRPERLDSHGIPMHDYRINPKDGSKEYYAEFREGRPEDYVSFLAGHSFEYQCEAYDYIKYNPDVNADADANVDPADPDAGAIYREIDDFMEKLFPDKKMREFMWRDLSSCLEGKNREQKYRTWIGVGGNGKSLLVSLMAITFGDYAMALPSQVLTRKRPDAGSANPDIMSIQNRRFIYTTEPDSGEPLNTSVMKQLSGEDSISARGLYQDQTKFQIAGKIYMLCNHYPQITSWDRGTWRRIWAFLFQSKFVNPDSEEAKDICPEKFVYPIDFSLPNRIFVWRKYFMAKLVHIYTTEYLKYGLEPVPDLVKNESNNYRSQFDSFGKFKIECIREDKFSDKLIKITVFYNAYRMWCDSTGSKKMGKTEFEKRMEGEFGKPMKSSYKRLKIINSDDDDDED